MTDEVEKDSIEASKAPLLDHLIELRQRLLWSVVAVFVCFIACFIFATDIYNICCTPTG
ncbi:MAG: twin-arginine translocase subunit TatC [Methyloligellaceae bacterium]